MANDDSTPDPGPDEDDDALLDWVDEDEDAVPRRRGLTMRHPVLLLLVCGLSIFTAYRSWPGAARLIAARQPTDCGDITERPFQRVDHPDAVTPLPADTYCRVIGVVQNQTVLATGVPEESPDLYHRDAGRKFYVKLSGDNVFAVLAADRRDVVDHRLRQSSLVGFPVDAVGHLFDPDVDPVHRATARTLRLKFSIPDIEPIRLFDTTDLGLGSWPNVVVLLISLIIGSVALFGLARLLVRRRRRD